MAEERRARYELEGDAKQFNTEMARAEKALDRVAGAAKKTDRATDRLTKRTKSAARPTANLRELWESVDQSGTALGGTAGDLTGRITNLGMAFSALGAGGGPIALTIGGAVAAGAALAGLGVGLTAAVLAADDLNESLQPFRDEGFGLDDEQLASINAVNDAFSSLGTILQQIVAEVGADFAPFIEEASFLLVKAGLITLDWVKSLDTTGDAIRTFAIDIVDKLFNRAIRNLLFGAQDALEAIGALAGAAGLDGLAERFEQQSQAFDDAVRGLAESAVDAVIGDISGAMDMLSTSTASYDERARALLETTRKQTKAYKDAQKEAEELAKMQAKLAREVEDSLDTLLEIGTTAMADQLLPSEELEAAYRRQNQAIDDQIAKLLELQAAGQDVEIEMAAATQARVEVEARLERDLAALRKKLRDDQLAEHKKAATEAIAEREREQAATFSAVQGTFSNVAKSAGILGDLLGEESKKTALFLFKVNKAAAIAAAIVNTAQAVTKALTSAPPPINFGLAFATAAFGGAQVAAIAAQPPPQFALGGLVPASAPIAAGTERLVAAQPNELLLTQSDQRELLDAMRRTANDGGQRTTVVQMRYRHRIFNEFVDDNLRIGGPLRREMTRGSGKRTGRSGISPGGF